MERLKCSSCGAELEVESNNEYAFCRHCGTRYKLKEDLNVNIKLDDNMKEVINTGLGTVKHASTFMIVPVIMFIMIFITIAFAMFKTTNTMIDTKDETFDKYEEEKIKIEEESKKYSFNFQFINANGTKATIFVKSTLDEIIQSNKTNERQVTLVFNGTETKEESEIIEIKHSLSGDYEVSLNYDDDGYINKILVDKIN